MKKTSRFFCLFLFLLFGGIQVFAQPQKIPKAPPTKENTYLFSIHKYNRQPKPSAEITSRINQIMANPKNSWTADDSLYFAYESVYLRKFDLALNIFARLNTDTIKSPIGQILYRTTLQHTGRFKELLQFNQRTLPDDTTLFYSVNDAFTALTKAYIKKKKGNFIIDSTLIFPILKDSIFEHYSKRIPPYKNKLSLVSFAIDSALRQFSILNKGTDLILSIAFKEMAEFQKKYLYLTNTYFYYSASLQYFRNDRNVINERNRIIDAMTHHNYLSIKFSALFGKIVKKRFNFSNHYTQQKAVDSTPPKHRFPLPIIPNKDYLPWINSTLLYLICIALILAVFLVFVRTKKK